ncbi:Homeobox protein KNOX3 [Hordeum vulgare]|nr:Homeobox protein KNOX3 [Hordeum vulgare]
MERTPTVSAVGTSVRTRPASSTVAEYPAPPDMWVPGSWRLSAGGVPVPPPPTGAERRAEIVRIRSGMPKNSHNLPRYAPDSNALWTALFECRPAN